MADLAGQFALVTGCSSGIGAAMTSALADAGCVVSGIDLRPPPSSLRAKMRAFRAIDATDAGHLTEFIDDVHVRLGPTHILMNNVGGTKDIAFADLTVPDWDAMFALNVRPAFVTTRAVLPAMIENGYGRIINVGSIAGRGWAHASNVAYASAKAALIAMTRVVALNVAASGVTVNAVCPGPTSTDLVSQILQERALAQGTTLENATAEWARHIPTGRANTPDEVADVALFLARRESGNITGQAWNIDGGIMGWSW